MFRFTQKPSSGSHNQCLAKNYKSCSTVRVRTDVVCVMAAYCAGCACVCVWFTVRRCACVWFTVRRCAFVWFTVRNKYFFCC